MTQEENFIEIKERIRAKPHDSDFTVKRRIIEALDRFTPGMETEEDDVPISLVVLCAFATLGFIHFLGYFEYLILWITR